MEENDKKNEPLITTIIPTYQRPRLLKRAILSVLNQTYHNFQVCVYDNASNDETADVIKKLSQQDSRVHYYCHSKNIGMVQNFNFGLDRLETSYFSFLCDDDVLLPDFYEKTLNVFKKYPEAGFIVAQTIIATEKEVKEISLREYEEKLYNPPEGLLKMSSYGTPTWTSILFRKEIIREIGLLDEKIGGPSDIDFLLRSASALPFFVLKSPCAIFLIHELSKSSTWSETESLNGYKKILEKIEYNKKISASTKSMVYQNLRKRIIRILWQGGFKDIKKRNFLNFQKISKSLKSDFNENSKSAILCCSIKLCRFSNIFYYFFLVLNKIRKSFDIKKKIKNKKLQNAYGAYLKYFSKYSE
jgi:glycosyltransferase involved in cell wall biosynthesis